MAFSLPNRKLFPQPWSSQLSWDIWNCCLIPEFRSSPRTCLGSAATGGRMYSGLLIWWLIILTLQGGQHRKLCSSAPTVGLLLEYLTNSCLMITKWKNIWKRTLDSRDRSINPNARLCLASQDASSLTPTPQKAGLLLWIQDQVESPGCLTGLLN